MQKFVVNIYPSQGQLPSFATVHRNCRELAHQATLSTVLLCAPRQENVHGYIGTAELIDVVPDPHSPHRLVLVFEQVQAFDAPIPPGDVSLFTDSDDGESRADAGDFHTYARGVRPIAEERFDRIMGLAKMDHLAGFAEGAPQADSVPDQNERQRQIRESYLRSQRLRFDALDHYGPTCAVTRLRLGPTTWWRHEVDICHIIPVAAGADDVVHNVMPIIRSAHWAFDNGLFTVRPNREIIFRDDAPADLRWLFRGNRQAHFPSSPLAWPKAENLEYHFAKVLSKVGL